MAGKRPTLTYPLSTAERKITPAALTPLRGTVEFINKQVSSLGPKAIRQYWDSMRAYTTRTATNVFDSANGTGGGDGGGEIAQRGRGKAKVKRAAA